MSMDTLVVRGRVRIWRPSQEMRQRPDLSQGKVNSAEEIFFGVRMEKVVDYSGKQGMGTLL
jgi:hypothetical protein